MRHLLLQLTHALIIIMNTLIHTKTLIMKIIVIIIFKII